MLNKSAKSNIVSNSKASIVELLQMYSEATASKSECERRYLQLLQDSATSNLTASNNQSNQLINELKRQLEQSERQLKEQGESLKRQQDLAVNGLKQELDKLRGEVDEKNISIVKMREAAKELQEQKYQELEALKQEYEHKISYLTQNQATQQEILQELRLSSAQLKENLLELQAKDVKNMAALKEQEEQGQEKDSLMETLRQDILNLQESLKTSQLKVEELQVEASKRVTLDQWLLTFQKSISVKNNIIQEQAQKLEELSRNVPMEYKDLHQSFIDQQNEFTKEKRMMEETICNHILLIEQHTQNIQVQQQKIQHQDQQIQELKSGLSGLVGQFAARENTNATVNEQMMQMREEHESEMDKLQQILEQTQVALNQAEKQKNELKEQYQDLQIQKEQEIQVLYEKVSLLEHTYNHLLFQYEVYLKRTTISFESFGQDPINESNTMKDFDKQTQDLYKEMDFMIESISQLNEQLKQSQERNTQLSTQLKIQNQEIEKLSHMIGDSDNPMENDLNFLSAQIQQLVNERASLKSKNSSLQKEIDFLRLKTTSQDNKMRSLEENGQNKQRQSGQHDIQLSEFSKILQRFQNEVNKMLHDQIGNGIRMKEMAETIDNQQILTRVKQLLEHYIFAVKSEMNKILQKVSDIHYHGEDKEPSPNCIREDFFTYSQRTSDLLDNIKSQLGDSNHGSKVSVTFSERSEKKERISTQEKIRSMRESTLYLMKKNMRTSKDKPFLTTFLGENDVVEIRKKAEIQSLTNMLDQDSEEEH